MRFVYLSTTQYPVGYALGYTKSEGGARGQPQRGGGKVGEGVNGGAKARKGSAIEGGGVFAGGVIGEGLPGVVPEYAPAFPVCLAAMARGAKRLKQIKAEGLRPVCFPRENMVNHFSGG
jgi:hypothetical protein